MLSYTPSVLQKYNLTPIALSRKEMGASGKLGPVTSVYSVVSVSCNFQPLMRYFLPGSYGGGGHCLNFSNYLCRVTGLLSNLYDAYLHFDP